MTGSVAPVTSVRTSSVKTSSVHQDPTSETPSSSADDTTMSSTNGASSSSRTSALAASSNQTDSTSVTTSVMATWTLPPSASTAVPTDDANPTDEPPANSRSHDLKGAGPFASWYVKWLLYAYVAHTVQPLVEYSDACAQCDEVVENVNGELAQGAKFEGELFNTLVIDSQNGLTNTVDVTIKWSNGGFDLVGSDGSKIRSYRGGSGFYVVTVKWSMDGWLVTEIRTIE